MREFNFEWVSTVEISKDARAFDLHNCFDFQKFAYDLPTRCLSLVWARGVGDWVRCDLPAMLSLSLFDVDHLAVTPRDRKMPISEDDCLDSYGYTLDGSSNDDVFLFDGRPDPAWRWVFTFRSEMSIIVGAERAVLKIGGELADV